MDVREKLVELLDNIYLPMMAGPDTIGEYRIPHKFKKEIADHLISNGVTVQDMGGCEYCKEDNEGYRKMIGAFSITNPFHGNVWNIETCHCKPRQIYFCPMCGRRLQQPQKEE